MFTLVIEIEDSKAFNQEPSTLMFEMIEFSNNSVETKASPINDWSYIDDWSIIFRVARINWKIDLPPSPVMTPLSMTYSENISFKNINLYTEYSFLQLFLIQVSIGYCEFQNGW